MHDTYDVRVFIEGIEIPVDTVTITHRLGGISTVSIPLPSVGNFQIKPRSLIIVAIKDYSGYYRVQFQGETTDPAQSWSTSSINTNIVGFSFDNHMDAIPITLTTSEHSSNYFDTIPDMTSTAMSDDYGGQFSSVALHGGSLNISIDPVSQGEELQISDINGSASQDTLMSRSIYDLPGILPLMYKTNKFWQKHGERTGMDSDKRYYYFKDGLFNDFQLLMSIYIGLMAGRQIHSNKSFRAFFSLLLRLLFANYFINHHSLQNHMVMLTGFEPSVPPTCNVVFPHQISRAGVQGKSLSTPTRTIVTASGVNVDVLPEAGALLGRAAIAGAPAVINNMLQEALYGDSSAIQDPVTAEENIRGVVVNMLDLSSTLGTAAALAYKDEGTTESLQKFMLYYASYAHSMAANMSAVSNINCSFLPDIQVGLPLVFFKPLDNKGSGSSTDIGSTFILGLANSVTHVISKSRATASTSITLNYAATLGVGGYSRPLPLWLETMGADDFAGAYSQFLGCGAAADGDLSGETGVEQSVLNYITKVADKYFAIPSIKAKVEYARNITKCAHLSMDNALSSYTYVTEKQTDVSNYLKNMNTFSKVIPTGDTRDFEARTGDIRASSDSTIKIDSNDKQIPIGIDDQIPIGIV